MELGQVGSRCSGAVTAEQTEALLEFIEQNPVLVKMKTMPHHNQSKRLWSRCAKKLNAYSEGAIQTSNQWAQLWSSLKQRVSKRGAKVKAGKDRGPNDAKLTPIDLRICNLIKKMEDNICEADIIYDPLAEDTNENEPSNHEDDYISPSRPNQYQVKRQRKAASRRTNAAAKLRKRPPTARPRGPHTHRRRPSIAEYEDILIESDSEDNLSAFLEMEKKKLEHAERVNEAVRGIREQFSDMYELFGELRDGIMASIITR